MTIGKSHSGGSDADDESLQPAKQPNRKSLSSVSFASTPFVRGSPSVPANVSPISLSFASKNSSYKSADGTFTSGSARTVRSSVGSASGSSVGDNSKVDPEEEVTITNDTTQPEGEFSRIFSSLKISLSNPVRNVGELVRNELDPRWRDLCSSPVPVSLICSLRVLLSSQECKRRRANCHRT